ncbi:MAG: response regulator [Cytophagaceae bacterium]
MEKYNCIMLVDDDPVTNFINFVTLSKMKISNDIAITRNGEEALRFISEFKSKFNTIPELILLDVLMPVMDGFEFLEKFEAIIDPEFSKSRVVMLSTLFTNSDINFLNQKGYSLFLNKPLEKEKLMEILEAKSLVSQ